MKILEWRPRLLQNWQMVACAGIGAFIVYCGALATQSSAYYMSDVAWARGIAASGSRFSTLRVCAGRSLAKAGLVEEGAREMEAAFALSHKGDLEAGDYIMLAVLERARGKRTEALDLLTRARMEFGDSAELEYHTGVLMADAGNVVGARDAFLRATELKPQLGPAWRNLGRANLKLKRFAESVKAYERAFAIVRPSTRDHLELGQAYAGAAMPDKAVRELQTVVSDDANGDLGSQAAGILRGIK